MYFAIITLLTAIGLATVAGWFSIIGVMAILAGAPFHALVAGVTIEIAKLVTTSWLYRNWNFATIKLKILLMFFTALIMVVTSMGVFGFLSKAHLEQGASLIDNTPKIERLDQQIAREKSAIDSAEKTLAQLDATLDSYIGKDRADRSVVIRKRQEPQRKQLKDEIDAANKRIDTYSDEKFKLQSEVRKLQLEVGPIRYISELIFGAEDNSDKNIESAVRIFILLLVLTLDPLAVTLLIAANNSLLRYQNEKKKKAEPPASAGFATSGEPPLSPQHERIVEPETKDDIGRPNQDVPQTSFKTTVHEEIPKNILEIIDEEPEIHIVKNLEVEEENRPTENGSITQATVDPIREALEEIRLARAEDETTEALPEISWAELDNPGVEEEIKPSWIIQPAEPSKEVVLPVIRSPKLTRIATKTPWMHQGHVLAEILGSTSHFIPQKLNEEEKLETVQEAEATDTQGVSGSAGQEVEEVYKEGQENNQAQENLQGLAAGIIADKIASKDAYPKTLSWLTEFKRT